MFDKDYKNQINSIKADGYIKDKIRRKMAEEQTPVKKKKSFKYFGTAVAAVLCIAIIGGSYAWNKNKIQKDNSNNTDSLLLQTAEDYSGIYKVLGEFKPTVVENIKDFINGGTKNEDDIEYVYEATEDGATEGATANTNGNSTNKGSANKNDGGSQSKDHSETTTQVDGVDEADVIKTNGDYIYILDGNNYKACTVKIVDIRGGAPKHIFTLNDEDIYANQIYLYKDRLVAIGYLSDAKLIKQNGGQLGGTVAAVYDISNPAAPKRIELIKQSGYYNSSRMIGDKLYLISDYNINVSNISRSNPESYVPIIECKDYDGAVAADTVCIYGNVNRPEYTVVSAYSVKNGSLVSSQSVLGGSNTVYSSTGNIITAGYAKDGKTQIARFEIKDGEIKNTASGLLNGTLLNQFSIDEYKGHFRFVLTQNIEVETEHRGSVAYMIEHSNSLVILDGKLKETGKIENIAPDERVYSVRFMGDIAYFVTFRQVDPLFSVDVSNPENPKIIGALKIPGFSNYLFPYGEGKLLGIGQNADEITGRTGNMKLSMFNILDPSNVTESSKTSIPSDYSYSYYNHKATLVDQGKNLIGFSAMMDNGNMKYYVYSFVNGQFVKRLEADFGVYYGTSVRGLYSGNIFYIATSEKVMYFNMGSFTKIGELNIK